jgi:hypothetical protein
MTGAVIFAAATMTLFQARPMPLLVARNTKDKLESLLTG